MPDSLTQQAIGFTLQLEANTLMDDIRQGEVGFNKMERSIARVAKAISRHASTIVGDVEKITKAVAKVGSVDPSMKVGRGLGRGKATTDATKAVQVEREQRKHRQKIEKQTEKIVKNTTSKRGTGEQPVDMQGATGRGKKAKAANDGSINNAASAATRQTDPVIKADEVIVESKNTSTNGGVEQKLSDVTPKIDQKRTEQKIISEAVAPPVPMAAQPAAKDIKAATAPKSREISLDEFFDSLPEAPSVKLEQYGPMSDEEQVKLFGSAGVRPEAAAKPSPRMQKMRDEIGALFSTLSHLKKPGYKDPLDGWNDGGGGYGDNKKVKIPRGVPSPHGYNEDDPLVPDMKAWASFLKDVAPAEWAKTISTGMNVVRVATGKTNSKVAEFFGMTVGKGAVAQVGLLILAIGKVTMVAADFQDMLLQVKRTSGATNDELKRMEKTTLSIAQNTGQALEEVLSVAGVLRGKGGFSKVNGDFEEIVDTAVKMSEIVNVNADEMADFLGETTIGMNVGTRSADKFSMALVSLGRKGGASFEELRDSVMGVKDLLRRYNLEQQQNLRIVTATAVAAQQLSKNYGDAADATNMLASATNRGSDDYHKLLRLISYSGEAIQGNLEEFAMQHPEKFYELAAKGAKNFMDTHGKAWAAFPDQIENYVGSVNRVVALSKMSAADLQKTFKDATKAGGKNEINEEFKEMMQSVSRLKERIGNMFEVFMVYVGKPLLGPIVFTLDKILSLIQMIPAPVMKTAGYVLAISMYLKTIQATMKSIAAIKAAGGIAGLFTKGGAGAAAAAGATVKNTVAGVAGQAGATAATTGILSKAWSKLTGLFRASVPAAEAAAATTGAAAAKSTMWARALAGINKFMPKTLGWISKFARGAATAGGAAVAAAAAVAVGYVMAVRKSSKQVDDFMRDTNRKSLIDYESTLSRREELDQMYSDARKAMAAGQNDEATRLFDEYAKQYTDNQKKLVAAEKAFQMDRVSAAIDAEAAKNKEILRLAAMNTEERRAQETKLLNAKSGADKAKQGGKGSWWNPFNDPNQQGFWAGYAAKRALGAVKSDQERIAWASGNLEKVKNKAYKPHWSKGEREHQIGMWQSAVDQARKDLEKDLESPYLPSSSAESLTEHTMRNKSIREQETAHRQSGNTAGQQGTSELKDIAQSTADGSEAAWQLNTTVYDILKELRRQQGGQMQPQTSPSQRMSGADRLAINGGGGG